MLRRPILLLLIVSSFIIKGHAQSSPIEFMYSAGAGTFYIHKYIRIVEPGLYFESNELMRSYAASNSLRLNVFKINKQALIAIGTHNVISFSWENINGVSAMNYFLELPLVAELHFGHKASDNVSSKKRRNYWEKKKKGGFGGFLGGGFAYSGFGSRLKVAGIKESNYENYFGPHIGAGVRFLVKKTNSITLRFSTTAIQKNDVTRSFFLGTEYNF